MAEVNQEEDRPFTKEQLKQLDALRPYVPFLDIMGSISPQQSEILTPYLKPAVHDALCTCVSNAIFNYKKFDNDCKERCVSVLKPKISHYTFLSDKRKTASKGLLRKRGKYIEETSTGIPIIVSSVLPSLGKALEKAAKQKAEAQAKRQSVKLKKKAK